MKYTELKSSIQEGAKQIYLLEGDDAYFRLNGEQQIKSAFLEMPELNYTAFDGESLKGSNITSLISALKNYPFMAPKRIVKVTEFYPSESEYENYLKPLFEDFPPDSILIIVNVGGKKGADLKRKHAVTFIDCGKAEPDTVAKWVYLTMHRAGVNISAQACSAVAEYCLCDMARVSVEVNKLIDYVGTGEITLNDVEELIFKDADFRLYELTGAVARGDYTKFCLIADELITKSGDEAYVLSGLFNYFKNSLVMLSSNDSDKELATLLKMKEYGVKKGREAARAIGEERLARLVEYIYGCISDVKSGKVTPQSAFKLAQNFIFFNHG
ncbi:MAG: DNA polymerase III subunit delta [Clostridia bacterium]|nr:DNA polymerase III subunit delta [Clostridia bacterium]